MVTAIKDDFSIIMELLMKMVFITDSVMALVVFLVIINIGIIIASISHIIVLQLSSTRPIIKQAI